MRPELQGLDTFAEGVDAIVEAQQRVAQNYFDDGSVEAACPPLKALLHIMCHGQYEGMDVNDPRLRQMFTRDAMLASDWYAERLHTKQQRDIGLWRRHLAALKSFRSSGMPSRHVDLDARLAMADRQLERVSSPAYLQELVGTIGADPFHGQGHPIHGHAH